jgi:GTP-binding protein Era
VSEQSKPGFVSGFVSILGRPNAGKSTLLNSLAGTKVAIVTRKPQTTRTEIQGVVTLPGAQIVFLDTPGIHEGGSALNRRMMEIVRAALEERDLLLFLMDATQSFTPKDEQALDLVKKGRAPVLLVLNKIDRLKEKSQLLPLIEKYKSLYDFADYIPVSALTGEGLDTLRASIIQRLPEGPAYFPPDHVTDQPLRFMAAELIREKIVNETREEVPHSVAVLIDLWEDTPKLTHVAATIYVEREGQKGIVIGSKGEMLKRIGTLARQEMERLVDRKVFLELFVKVRPRWRESQEFLKGMDWRSMAGMEAD